MATEIAQLYASVGADTRKFEKGMAGVKGQLGTVQKSFGGLKTAVAGLGVTLGAIGAAQIAGFAFELAKGASESQRVADSYNQLAQSVGESGDAMLATLRRVTANTISDTDLQLAANKALSTGVGQNAEQIAALLEVAAARGRAFGLTTTEAFDRLAQSLATGRQEGLRSLGVVLDTQKVYEDYAKTINKTVGDLDQLDKTQALTNATIRESADLVGGLSFDDLTAGLESFDAATANLKDAVGGLLNSQPVIDFLIAFAKAVDNTATALNNLETSQNVTSVALQTLLEQLGGAEPSLQNLSNQFITAQNEAGKLRERFEQLNPAEQAVRWLSYQAAIAAWEAVANSALSAMDDMNVNLEMSDIKARDAARGMEDLAGGIDEASVSASAGVLELSNLAATMQQLDSIAQGAQNRLRNFSIGLIPEFGLDAALSGFETSNRLLENQVELWREAGLSETEVLFRTEQFVNALTEGYDTQKRLTAEATKTSTAVGRISSAYNDVKSKVSSLIGAAIGPVAGVDANDLLPREDAINENARRLADIAINGLNPMAEWFDEFRNEAPMTFAQIVSAADPQAAAKELLKNFQDGLIPELIDKDKAAELVKRAIVGGAEVDKLIDEVAQDVATDLGISLAEAQAKAQSVLGGTTAGGAIAPEIVTDVAAVTGSGDSAGVAYGQGVTAAIANLGQSITTNLVTQLKSESNLTAIGNAGATQGRKWGNDFLSVVSENVPGELINILVDLVTPGVQAAINAQGSLNGAAA